jgi:hypothetical protein
MRTCPILVMPVLLLSFATGACSPDPDRSNNASSASVEPVSLDSPIAPPPPADPATPTSTKVIGLEGLADLRIGQPVPAGSSWAPRGAQISDDCRTFSSPDYPGVYAIVSEGKVQRITVGQRSDVKLVEGIGAGATEKAVRDSFPGFREEPHKYSEAPAKYLTAPNAPSGDSALRFEIGQDGLVSLVHVGMMPVLGYVEGCA